MASLDNFFSFSLIDLFAYTCIACMNMEFNLVLVFVYTVVFDC